MPDSEYLNSQNPELVAHWLGESEPHSQLRRLLTGKLPRMRDDFVTVPLPRLAAAEPKSPVIGEAVREYEKQAKVVDTRLFRKISLRLKQVPLADLCEELTTATGVRFSASRGIGDEQVTLFVKEQPARDIMRELSRFFGYAWERSGDEGAYRYELRQDLRSQLAEEEMRNRDVHAALAALDEDLARYRPYLHLTPEQAKARLERNPGADKELLKQLAGPLWGPIQVYHRLSPGQLQSLANGGYLEFSTGASNPDLRLPDDWRQPLLGLSKLVFGDLGGTPAIGNLALIQNGTALADIRGAEAVVGLFIERPELGKFHLDGGIGGSAPDGTALAAMGAGAARGTLSNARSPSVAPPDNAVLNAALRDQPPFRQQVTVRPKPSCPRFSGMRDPADREALDEGPEAQAFYFDGNGQMRPGAQPSHVSRADVWEAIHDATGLPVLTDSYSAFFETRVMTLGRTSTFDSLCRLGDTMGVRWQKDGDFILARSTAFFWDKLKETPVRLLRRWQNDRRKHGYLPLADLAEMSTCSDAQLDSAPLGGVIGHCWGLEEWGLVGPNNANFRPGLPGGKGLRPYCRFLATLNNAQLATALTPGGIAFASLSPLQREALLRVANRGGNPQDLLALRVHVDYIPIGAFYWNPSADTETEAASFRKLGLVFGSTADLTLAAARRVYAAAVPEQIRKSRGVLVFSFSNPQTGAAWDYGSPAIAIRINP
jgi:hypothetical protein